MMVGEPTAREPERVRVTYVAGYGRSGSTLLDRLLAQRTGAFGAGEMCQVFGWADARRLCACGSELGTCEMWGPVLEEVRDATALELPELHAITRAAELHGRREAEWQRVWQATFDALLARGVRHVVDSSKTAQGRRRPVLLSKLGVVDLSGYVHLVRDLRAVVHSRRRGNNYRLEAGESSGSALVGSARAIWGWWSANSAATRMASCAHHALTVGYGDLAREPERVLNEVMALLGLDPDPVQGEASDDAWHNVAGNRFIRGGWTGTVSPDESWRAELSTPWKVMGASVQWAATKTGRVPPIGSAELAT